MRVASPLPPVSSAQGTKRTTAQTQYLEMIPPLRIRQREHCWRKEHGLIVWVSDQEADTLVGKARKRVARNMSSVEPACYEKDGHGEGKVELH